MSATAAPLPSFCKGQKVVANLSTEGVRPMTREEEEAWYAKAQGWGPHDSAGESWVCSGTQYIEVPAGTTFVVVRARVTATVGWYDRPGYAEVKSLATGEVFKVQRRDLRPA
jgi:hypothetical protein